MDNPSHPSSNAKLKKAAAGAAIVAIPVVGGVLYLKMQHAVETGNQKAEKGFQYDDSALKVVDPALIKWKSVGQYDSNIPQAQSLTVDPSGGIWVGGEGIVRRIAGGQPTELRITGTAHALATDETGAVYVALADHVEIFGPDGVQKSVLPSLGDKANLTSIAVGSGNIYVGDFGNLVVHRLDKSGKTLNVIGKADASKGYKGLLLPSPHLDVAISADGTLWLADTGRHQLENYTPAGNLERFWARTARRSRILSVAATPAISGCCPTAVL